MAKFLNDIIIQGEDFKTSLYHDPCDISTWQISEKELSVNAQEANPEAIFFKPDGTKMYIAGRSGDDVNEYALSTAWDITTASFTDTLDGLETSPASESNPYGMYISPDGIYFYLVGHSTDQVIQYTMSTAWDISTASYTREQDLLIANGNDFADPIGINFKSDGTMFWVVSQNSDAIQQYTLSTPWDVSTLSVGHFKSLTGGFFTLHPLDENENNYNLGSIEDIWVSEDGTKVWMPDSSYDTVHQLKLSTPFNITTATYDGCTTRVTAYQGDFGGIYVNEAASKAFTCAPSGDWVRSWDFGGLVFSNDNEGGVGFLNGVTVKGDIVNNGLFNQQGRSSLYAADVHSTFTAYGTANITHSNGGTVNILDNTTYSNPGMVDLLTNVRWGRNNVDQNPYTNGLIHNINLGSPREGAIINLNLGRRQTGNTVSRDNTGIYNIVSKAQTFTHDGYLTVGQKLQVTGNADLQAFDLGGTVIFSDTFTETNTTALESHTPDTGAGWTKTLDTGSTSTWNVIGGTGVAQVDASVSSAGMIYLCDTLPTAVDYEIKVDFLRRDSSDDTFHIIFKYKDADNFFYLSWSASYSTYCKIRKKEGGSHSDIATFDYGVFNSTSDNLATALKVRFIDNKIMVWDIDTNGYQAYRGSFDVTDFTNDGNGGTFHKFGMGIGAIDGGSHDQTNTWKIDKFEVKQLSSAATLANSTHHYILNGNVGIGTTDPAYARLQVAGTTLFQGASQIQGDLSLRGNVKDLNKAASAFINTRTRNTSGSELALEYDYVKSFNATNGGSIGIGTSSPNEKVHVYANGADVALKIEEDAGSHQAKLHLRRGGSDWEIINDNHLTIEGEGAERLRITTGGDVGIGTITPSSKLDVIGDADTGVIQVSHTSNGAYGSILFGSINRFTGDNGSWYLKNTNSNTTQLVIDDNNSTFHNDIVIDNHNGSNPTDAGSLYFNEAGTTWGTDMYGFRINQEGSSNLLQFQSVYGDTNVNTILTLNRDNKSAVFGGGLTIPDYIYHAGDANAYFGFEYNDAFRIVVAGGEKFHVDNSRIRFNEDILLLDNHRLNIGSDNDMFLFHDDTDAVIRNNKGHVYFDNLAQDKDIYIRGNDNGSTITALTLDMSEAGKATFNSHIFPASNLGANIGSSSVRWNSAYFSGLSLTGALTTVNIQSQGTYKQLNKAQTAYLDTFVRDASGSEVVTNLSNIGTISTAGNIQTTGDIVVGAELMHSGDTDTKIRFDTDRVRIYANNKVHFDAHDNGNTIISSNNGTALTLDSSQNATFAGSATFASTIAISDGTWHGLTITGSGQGHTQGAIILKSGTSDTPEARGQGIYMFNEGDDVTWYTGTQYQDADTWMVARKAGTSIDSSAATDAQSFFKINNSGNATFAGNVTVNGTAQLGNALSDKAIVHGHLGIGHEAYPKIAYPGQNALWGEANNSTVGQVVIDIPGTLANYDMLYIEIDIYEYNSTNATKLIIGGHNWNSGGDGNTSSTMWYNAGVKVIGSNPKSVYLGWRNDGSNNRRVIAIGEVDSTWNYPTIHVAKVHGNDGYSSSFDLIGDWAMNLTTSSSFFTKNPTTNWNATTATTFETTGKANFGGVLALPDGSVSAPSINNTGDTNTGMYFPGDNQVGFAVDGSRKFYMSTTEAFFQNLSSGVSISAGGIDVTGDSTFSGDVNTGDDLNVGDDVNIAGDQLTFTNDAASAYIRGADALFIESDFDNDDSSSKPIYFYTNGTEMARMEAGVATFAGEVEASSLDINGNADISGDLGVAGAIYQTNNGTQDNIGVFAPMVQGGMYATSASTVTGRLRVKVPGYKSLSMQTFYIDIYEYNTDRSATYRVSGYNYSDTNASWYNTSVVALFDSDNRDLTVRFGADTSASEQYVAIGEVDSTWSYPQVVIRDYTAGYGTTVSEGTGAFNIEFVTTDSATYNVNHDNNQPFANWSKLEGIPSNVTNALSTGGGNVTGNIEFQDNIELRLGAGADLKAYHSGTHTYFDNNTGDLIFRNLALDQDIIFSGNDGGTTVTPLTLDMSEGGKAVFAGTASFAGNVAISGNLTTEGDLIINNTSNVSIKDTIITLNSGITTADNRDIGVMFERVGNNKFFGWDEDESHFTLAENTQDVSVATTTQLTMGALQTLRANVHVDTLSVGDENPAQINAIKDEDNMSSDSATSLATQQSIKAYADTKLSSGGGTMTGAITMSTADDHINFDVNNAAIFDNSNNNNAYYIRNGGTNAATLQMGTGSSPGSNIKLTLDGSGNATFVGNVSHAGLTPTTGTSVDQIKEFDMTFTLSANTWTDTGINSSDLASGTYAMQVFVDDHNVGGGHYDEYYSATISWFGGITNNSNHDEIVTHNAGHASNASHLQFRTQRHTSGGDDLMLQVKQNFAHSAALDGTNGKTMTFKFRRLI